MNIKMANVNVENLKEKNGDVNGDGSVDFKDLVKINQVRLNKADLDEKYIIAADVTGDGNVDFKDLLKINRYRLNKTEL